MADRSEVPPSGQAAPIERQGSGKESVPPETNAKAPHRMTHNVGEHTLYTRYAARLFKRSRRDTYVSLLVATLTAALSWRTLVELRDPTRRLLTLVGLAAWLLCSTSRRYLARHARLLLTPRGIAYRSPLPSFLQWLHPSWSLQWSDLVALTLQPSRSTRYPGRVALVFDTGTQRRVINPLRWVEPRHTASLSEPDLARELRCDHDRQERQEMLRESPLLRYLTAVGLSIDVPSISWLHPGPPQER